jgi:predicted O-methyltransferase YrrM
MSRPATPDALARARRDWLDGMRNAHRDEPSVRRTLDLGGAEWRSGNYDAALALFLEASARAPTDEAVHLAVLRALTGLGQRQRAEAYLQPVLRSGSVAPKLALVGAQLRFNPADPARAREVLAMSREPLPILDLWAAALDCIESGVPPIPRATGDDALDARWNGFCWLLTKHPAAHLVGLPGDVLEHAAAISRADGLVLECGVYFGRSIRNLARHLGQATIHGFDSFEGLPEARSEREPAGSYSTAGHMPDVPGHVILHRGWFERTLPEFLAREASPIRLLHIDCDLYRSARTVLEAARERLVPGSLLVFDDFIGFPGSAEHEFRAFMEFADRHGLRWQVLAGCLLGREVCIEVLGG